MADEQEGASGGDAGGGSTGQDIQSQVNEAIGKLGSPGEQLLALGAVLLVFVDIFGDLIFDEWFVRDVQLVPAWFVIAAVILYRFRSSPLPVSYVLLLAVLGFASGFVGVRQILSDLGIGRDSRSLFDRDTAPVIYGLIVWAGSILMLAGAIQLWPSANKS